MSPGVCICPPGYHGSSCERGLFVRSLNADLYGLPIRFLPYKLFVDRSD